MISLLVWLLIIGVVVFVINRVAPMEGNIKLIFNAVVAIAVLLYVLNFFGLIHGYVPHLR